MSPLQKLRKALGVRQKDLAPVLGRSEASLRVYEKTNEPPKEVLERAIRVADKFGHSEITAELVDLRQQLGYRGPADLTIEELLGALRPSDPQLKNLGPHRAESHAAFADATEEEWDFAGKALHLFRMRKISSIAASVLEMVETTSKNAKRDPLMLVGPDTTEPSDEDQLALSGEVYDVPQSETNTVRQFIRLISKAPPDAVQRFKEEMEMELQADQILSLPVYPELEQSDLEQVAKTIREFYGA